MDCTQYCTDMYMKKKIMNIYTKGNENKAIYVPQKKVRNNGNQLKLQAIIR